jgi:hypothetical protein
MSKGGMPLRSLKRILKIDCGRTRLWCLGCKKRVVLLESE